MNFKPVLYYQTDVRWRYNDYSAPGEKTTIGASGCGPTSMAMILATWADKSITPATECRWALQHGYKCPHSGTYYGYFVPAASRYGLTCERLNTASIYGNKTSTLHKKIVEALKNGDLVIACMGKGTWTSSGHYIVAYWVDEAKNLIYINDPASSRAERVMGNYNTFKSQVKYYWVVHKPKTVKKEEPDMSMTETDVRKIVREELASDAFKKAITEAVNEAVEPRYERLEDLPYGDDTIAKLVNANALRGDGHGLDLPETMLKTLMVVDRMGAFKDD